jgi:pilus assembly protein CpaE
MGADQPILHAAADLRQAVEAARSRRPHLALVEMTRDLRLLKTFTEEVKVGSPETIVAALFRPDVFGYDVSESAVLIEALRSGVRDFLRRPVSSHDLGQLLLRLNDARESIDRPTGKIVSLVSNKGGVGKSTLSVNIARGLAQRRPERVLLVDLSLQMGVCASMLDLNPTLSLSDALRQRDRLDETLLRQLATVHPSGLHLLASPACATDAAEIDDELISRVLTLGRRAYDFVIVDTFPMLDRVVMSALDLSDRVYIVLENVVPTLQSGGRLIELLDGMSYDRSRQRVVLNRYTTGAGNLKAPDVALQLRRNVDHIIPYDRQAVLAANTGRPFVETAGRFSRLGRRIRELVRDVDQMSPVKRPAPAIIVPPVAESRT